MLLSDTAIKRPVFAVVISLLLLAFGLLAFERLPLREYPDIDPPIVSIRTVYTGASAEVVESRITQVIEDRIAGIEGIETIESPGMLMQVVLITSEREGILIPESALLSEQLHHYVWLLSDGKAEQRQVELGVRKPGFVEIRSGLSAGEQLIYEGIGNLQAGMAVAPQGNK